MKWWIMFIGLILSWFLSFTTTGKYFPEGNELVYFIFFIIMITVFSLKKDTRIIVTVFCITLGILFLLSFLTKFAFPTLPIISDIVTSILAIGIRSSASLLFLIAVFFVGGELKKGNKTGLLVKSAFLFNGILWILQVFGKKWELTGILHDIYKFVNLDIIGYILFIIGMASWAIYELKK